MTEMTISPQAASADQPVRLQRKLKLLCRRPLESGQPTSALVARFMERIDCAELHLAHITAVQTEDFAWATLLTLSLPEHALADLACSQDYADLVVARLGRLIPALGRPDELDYALVDERGFGAEHDQASLVISTYRWQPAATPAARQRAMLEHLVLEQSQPIYQAVHFNTLAARQRARDFDFLFEGYIDDPQGIEKLYADPWLQKMRRHSELFLDTSTRKLAFGRVEIVRLAD